MKNLVITFFFVLAASIGSAQVQPTVAMDFSANDCDGTPHNLFAELEDGNVILMEFIMLDPCVPCVKAREALQPMYEAFNASHPGKFRIYTIGWTNSISCSQIDGWMNNHDFANTFFSGNGDMTDYYGGMGMPTIVLVAGKDHKVLYINDLDQGFKKADTTLIKSLIAEALTSADVRNDLIPRDEMRVYPNPATDIIRIALSGSEAFGQVEVVNVLGQVVAIAESFGSNGEMNVAGLKPGLYKLLYSVGGRDVQSTFIKR